MKRLFTIEIEEEEIDNLNTAVEQIYNQVGRCEMIDTQILRKMNDAELARKTEYYRLAVDLALDIDTMFEMYDNFFECSKEQLRRLNLKMLKKQNKNQIVFNFDEEKKTC